MIGRSLLRGGIVMATLCEQFQQAGVGAKVKGRLVLPVSDMKVGTV